MNDTLLRMPEYWTAKLLQSLGSQGILDLELRGEDLDRLLAAGPPIMLSTDFEQRARAAMIDAQRKRQELSPTLALGMRVARSRVQAGLSLTEVAGRIGISVRLLEALEAGLLPTRQLLHNLPPKVAAQLLATIDLAVHEFTGRLVDLAAAGRQVSMSTASRVPDHQPRREAAALVAEVADYVATLERIVRSDKTLESEL
jgi:hypothetical protein